MDTPTHSLFSISQMDKVAHALGINFYHAMLSHKLKDKILPTVFYRNYYQIHSCDALDDLVKKGFAVTHQDGKLNYYIVTAKGLEQFRNQFTNLIKYVPKKDRGIDYLKQRIELYCVYNNYRFGGSNFSHILSEYENKFTKGIYVSHTTKDVCLRFKNELKALIKMQSLKLP